MHAHKVYALDRPPGALIVVAPRQPELGDTDGNE